MPVPAREPPPAGHAIELVEQARQGVGGHARAAVLDVRRTQAVAGVAGPRSGSRVPGRRVLEGVLHDVGDRLVEEDRVGVDRRGRQVHVERPVAEPRPRPLERPGEQVVELEDVALGAQSARPRSGSGRAGW